MVPYLIDDRQLDGQFILTGSATPSDDVTRHSGVMRVARIRMHPMSLQESGDSTGQVSLGASPTSLAAEPGASGQLFESPVFRDLSVDAQANDADVYAY